MEHIVDSISLAEIITPEQHNGVLVEHHQLAYYNPLTGVCELVTQTKVCTFPPKDTLVQASDGALYRVVQGTIYRIN